MKIQLLNRNQVDDNLWNNCISEAKVNPMYAKTWYLDPQTEWEAIVVDNYKIVIPLPFKKKYGIKYYSNPALSQQLGIYSSSEISNSDYIKILNYIPKKHLKYFLRFNSKYFPNKPNSNFKTLKNYILKHGTLDLNNQTKRNLKKAEKYNLEILYSSISVEEYIGYHKQYFTDRTQVPLSYYNKIKELIENINKHVSVEIISAYHKQTIHSSVLFFTHEGVSTLMMLFSSEEGKKSGASTLIVNDYISNNTGTIDFEGSNLTGVERFYKGFGAINHPYFEYDHSKFPLLRKVSIS
jgi:hypothetical protein